MRRGVEVFVAVVVGIVAVAYLADASLARVLRVGTYRGSRGQYRSIQAAVNAARPGDWILVAPGDYKTTSFSAPADAKDSAAAVLITTPRLHLRGMDRNRVVIDGTKPGSAKCSAAKRAQNLGPKGDAGKAPKGLNGIMVWKARSVSVENLSVCNFLGGTGDAGNGVWWNGGDGSGKVGGHGFLGRYLSATSTFYASEDTAAQYGVFSSNWSGGTWDYIYGSNFNDSAFYIGACQQICDQVVDHAHGQYSALGYSGSNSGGSLVVENSEFDHNKDGFDTNSQNGDNPPPQNGACPGNRISPITHTHSCWVFMHNYVHDNNNPNVPYAGLAGSGPVGTGMSVSGGRNDTIMDNTFKHNGAWGLILVPFLDSGPPCTGGEQNALGCLYDEWGDAVLNNKFSQNGFYRHPSNGDIAEYNFDSGHPTNCYAGNTESGGKPATTSPSDLQQTQPRCDGHPMSASTNTTFLNEVLCNSEVELVQGVPASCPSGQYPRRTRIRMHPLRPQRTMPNPCQGVPANPWCRPRRHR